MKIDRSFVRDAAVDRDHAAIVQAVVSLARAMKLKVVAEGVETPEQLEALRRYGCDMVQGYLFSKPVSTEDITRMLRDGNASPEVYAAPGGASLIPAGPSRKIPLQPESPLFRHSRRERSTRSGRLSRFCAPARREVTGLCRLHCLRWKMALCSTGSPSAFRGRR